MMIMSQAHQLFMEKNLCEVTTQLHAIGRTEVFVANIENIDWTFCRPDDRLKLSGAPAIFRPQTLPSSLLSKLNKKQ